MNKIFFGFLVLMTLHFIILQKITFTAWPEMFSYPYLLDKGFFIYKDYAHPYEPLLTTILFLVYKVFGFSLSVHKLFVWGIIFALDVLIFISALKIFGKKYISLIPVFGYVLLQPFFDGNMLWFDLGATPFILLGLFSLLHFKKERQFFITGIFWSLSLFIKQQSALIFIIVGFYLLYKKRFLDLRQLILGSLIPAFLVLAILGFLNILPDYFFWTVQFPLYWLPKFPGYSQLPTIGQNFNIGLLVLPIIVFALINFKKLSEYQKICFLVLVATLAMSLPRFSYFHLQPAIAVAALFFVTILKEQSKRVFLYGVPVLLLIFLGWSNYHPFIGVKEARFYDESDNRLATFVQGNSNPAQKIYLIGPHPLIYVLADRTPVKPLIENYVWHFEIPGMQDRFIQGLSSSNNVIFMTQPKNGNWFDLETYRPKMVMEYIYKNYEKVNQGIDGVEVWARK